MSKKVSYRKYTKSFGKEDNFDRQLDETLDALKTQVDSLTKNVNTITSRGDADTYTGKPGDIKINKIAESRYEFYIRGEDGWHKDNNASFGPIDKHKDLSDPPTVNMTSGQFNYEYEGNTRLALNLDPTKISTASIATPTLKGFGNLKLESTGNTIIQSALQMKTIPNADTDPDKFLVLDASDNVKYRTGAQILTDLGITADEILDWTADQGSNNIHASNMAAAQTDITSILNSSLKIGRDSGNQISFATDNVIIFKADDETELRLNATTLRPHVNDGLALGNTSYQFSDLHLASGGVINWDNGNTTLTHAAGKLTLNNILEFGSLSDGTITITDFVDEDNMASNSAVKVPTQQSVKAYVDSEITGLVDSAPGALDTLNELAAALNDDASFSTTITNSLATKLNLSGGSLTGAIDVTSSSQIGIDVESSFSGPSGVRVKRASGDSVSLLANYSGFGGGLSSTDALRFTVNDADANSISSPAMYIETDGNVGIGTTSPNSKLQVEGSDHTQLQIKSTDGTKVPYLALNNTDMNWHLRCDGGIGDKFIIRDNTNSANRLTIDTTGNVGIGTTSPSYPLHVKGGRILVDGDGSNSMISLQNASGNRFANILNTGGDSDSTIAFQVGEAGSPTEAMIIHEDGRVGIGVTDPDSKVEIIGEGTSNSTKSLEIKDSGGTNLFYVRDDGVVSVTHNYLFVQAGGIYSTYAIRARGGITDDGGALGLGSDGSTNHFIITSGNITTGVWNGTPIASAYLDSDTAHLSEIQTFTGRKTINTSFPQLSFTDDSNTDYVQIGLSGNTYYHKTSDTGINFGWRDNSNNDILSIDTSAQTVTIGEGAQENYALKIGDNGRMNMPQRGLEFENAHGYFSPLGDMMLPLFINSSQTDLIRFETPLTWEYYDYSASAYVDDMSNVGNLQNMLDGRRTSAYAVSNTKRKFRFVITRGSSWADDHLFYIENTWSSIGTWTSSASGGGSLTPTMVVERLDGSFDASDDSNNDWTTNSGITTDWHTTGIWNGFGLAMYYSTGMHNAETHIRITVTFPEFADASKTIGLKNIGIISSYSSAATNKEAFVQDFNRNATGYGDVNIPTGHTYKINAATVLSGNGLGSGIINSSLTSVGTLGSLTVSGDATFDTTTLKVDSSNNRVGIGTASPSQGLHVVDAGAIVAEFESSDSTTTMVHIENSAGEDGYVGVTNDGLVFSGQNYNSNNMIVDTSGNVGIGTTSPAQKLDVSGNVNITGTITNAEWNGDVIASAYLDSDTAHLSGTQTFTGAKTFSSPVTIHTTSDAMFNLKTADGWAYMQFLENDGTRRAYIGMDADLDRLILNATENGANEIEINTTTVDINANVDISGNITAGAITSGFGNIDIGSSTLDAGNTVLAGDLRVGDGTEGIRLLNISSNIAGIYGVDTGGSAWNSIHIKADGEDGLFIEKDTNKVGIGTTSPSVNLHVKDDSGSNTLETIRIENSNGYAELGAQSTYVRLLAGGSLTYAANSSASYFYIGGSGKMGLTSTGLGIGTTAPSTALEIQDGLTTTGAVMTLSTKEPSVVANDVLGRINFQAPLDTGADSDLVGASIVAIAEDTFSDTVNSTSLQFQTGTSETATTRMTIDEAGKVGIGTTSPVAALTVKSNSTSSGNSGFTLMDNSDTNPIVQIGEKSTDGGRLHMYDGGTLKVSLYTDGTDNFINAGNVGIGNTSPNHLLHVGDDATAVFGTAPDKAIQLSSTTNDHEIAYILYAADGTNNIRSKYYIDDDTQYVGWDATHSTGLFGYEWKIANTQKMTLDTSGNLEITGNLKASNLYSTENIYHTDDTHTRIQMLPDRFLIYAGNVEVLDYQEDADSTLEIDNSGIADITFGGGNVFFGGSQGSSDAKVGIGTTSPTSTLHISDASSSGVTSLSLNNRVKVRGDGVVTWGSAAAHGTLSWDSGKTLINSQGTNDLQISAGGNHTDHIYIDGGGSTNDGCVGIGTNSPDEKLHVVGDLKVVGNISSVSGGATIGDSAADTFRTTGHTYLATVGNNVGIGTTSPTTTLDVEGSVSYKHISLTADSDDLDVSDCTVVECTPSGTDRLGGLTGGVQGQVIHILKVDSGFGRIIIEHNEGTGNQDIFFSGEADVMLSKRGGITLYCNGTSWFALDK